MSTAPSIGIVETQYFTFAEDQPLALESGESLGPITLNLVILTFSFDLSLRFNLITVLGIFVGWYYLKHTY